jgi:hypothetical protein
MPEEPVLKMNQLLLSGDEIHNVLARHQKEILQFNTEFSKTMIELQAKFSNRLKALLARHEEELKNLGIVGVEVPNSLDLSQTPPKQVQKVVSWEEKRVVLDGNSTDEGGSDLELDSQLETTEEIKQRSRELRSGGNVPSTPTAGWRGTF